MRRILLAVYRVRAILYAVGAALLLVGVIAGVFALGETVRQLRLIAIFAGLGLLALSLLLILLGARVIPDRQPLTVSTPVRGRWMGLNSPASAVPSHGVRLYGQAYAIDLIHAPEGEPRPEFGVGSAWRAPAEYPAFGRPVLSMVDGTVVTAVGRHRDHRARSGALSLVYMIAEGAVREIGGPRFVIGNHLVIRTDDGVFAVVAHLRKGSLRVRVGDAVRAGDPVGDCGNSGNSSEPHVHAQLMDRRSPLTGQGIPMAFADIEVEGERRASGIPANGEHLTA